MCVYVCESCEPPVCWQRIQFGLDFNCSFAWALIRINIFTYSCSNLWACASKYLLVHACAVCYACQFYLPLSFTFSNFFYSIFLCAFHLGNVPPQELRTHSFVKNDWRGKDYFNLSVSLQNLHNSLSQHTVLAIFPDFSQVCQIKRSLLFLWLTVSLRNYYFFRQVFVWR